MFSLQVGNLVEVNTGVFFFGGGEVWGLVLCILCAMT